MRSFMSISGGMVARELRACIRYESVFAGYTKYSSMLDNAILRILVSSFRPQSFAGCHWSESAQHLLACQANSLH